ncbi:MAG: UvrD-helicase domain-containing protein [Bacilli bacterium]
MSERVWSRAQEQAITARGGAVLVSAGAGSGKTSVLVERVKRLVLVDALDIDRILIVTFTEAAAAEMRARIAAALREAVAQRPSDAHLARQLHLLDRAAISTLHSFCLQVIRSAALELPVDPGFRIADDDEAGMLRFGVLERLLDDRMRSGSESFLTFADRYGGSHRDARLGPLILELYDFTRSQPHPGEWLDTAVARAEQDATLTLATVSFAAELFASFEHALRFAMELTGEAMNICARDEALASYGKTLQSDADLVAAALQCVLRRDFEGLRTAVAKPFSRLAQAPDADDWAKERVKQLRGQAKQAVVDIAERLAARSETDLLADLAETAAHLRVLAQLASGFASAYQEAKRRRGCVDFADLEHMAYHALDGGREGEGGQSSLARQFARRFEAILVDEYQDTSPIQDAILSLVVRSDPSNEFQVGDVKQSIYRFRMAEPNLFLRKYDLYARGQGGRRIDLQDNYRSREGVVDAVNFLFGQLFAPALGGIVYDARARMRAQASYPPVDGGLSLAGAVELHLIDRAVEDAEDDAGELGDAAGGARDAAGQWRDGGREMRESVGGLRESGGGMQESVGGMRESGGGMQELVGGMQELVGETPRSAGCAPDEVRGAGESAPPAENDAAGSLSAIEMEAQVIGQRLLELHRRRVLVWQPEAGVYRPIRWRDMVVLLRSRSGRAEPMMRIFRQLGIPVYGESDSGYYTGLEMRLALALLDAVDNPLQDIALASVLRSPMCDFRTSDLAALRAYSKAGMYQAVRRCAAADRGTLSAAAAALADRADVFCDRLQRWRTFVRSHSVKDSVAHLLTDSGLLDFVTALSGGAVRLANLRALQRQAAAYDELYEGGFSGFVAFLRDHQMREGDAGSARTLGENEDVVRVMTIHKSKGLEFPVVCVADLGKRFRLRDGDRPIRFHRTLGLCADRVDLQRKERWTTAAAMAIDAAEQRERLAEEARILYVALTRARERLILVGSMRNLQATWSGWVDRAGTQTRTDAGTQAEALGMQTAPTHTETAQAGAQTEEQAEHRALQASILLRAKRSLDWIGPAVYRFAAEGSPFFAVSLWGEVFDRPTLQSAAADMDADTVDWRAVSELRAGAIDSLHTVDQTARQVLADAVAEHVWLGEGAKVDAPAKMSVTEWKNNWQDADLEDDRQDVGASILAASRASLERPQFIQRERALTGAERGTLFHVAMQRASLAQNLADEAVAVRELSVMTERGYLPKQHAGAVSPMEIAAFFQSPLGQLMLQAPERVRREVSFTMAAPVFRLAARRPARFGRSGESGETDESGRLDGFREVDEAGQPNESVESTESGKGGRSGCPDGAECERVLVQGTVDCLIINDDGVILLDYKTDHVYGDCMESAKRYELQVELYREAIERAYGRPVQAVYLYFSSVRQTVQVRNAHG